MDRDPFCRSPHPRNFSVPTVSCKWLKGHPDDYHSAYAFGIETPETWTVT